MENELEEHNELEDLEIKDVKVMAKLPKALHTKLKIQSAKETKSMNFLIIEALKEFIK